MSDELVLDVDTEKRPTRDDEAAGLIARLRESMTRRQLAESMGVSTSTVERWELGTVPCKPAYIPALQDLYHGTTKETGKDFRTVDLFAGIGGIRRGFASAGGHAVFSSEWNEFSTRTYRTNYGFEESMAGDITEVDANDIPDCDVVLAGFPCQPFSVAGVSKKRSLGRETGFRDKTQGTLFFDVARIIAAKRPAAFLLENVKNLTSHDRGRTFKVILDTLKDELGYEVHWKVIDGQHFVPQHRERIYIAGFRSETDFTWDDLEFPERKPVLSDILHKTDGSEPYLPWDSDRFFDFEKCKVQDKYTLTPRLWQYLQDYKKKHEALGHGFGYGLVTPDMVSRTLSARYHKDGSEILVKQEGKRPRRLTPRECARLMGYPDDFRIPVSDTQAYRQFGNSVVVPAVAEVARIMRPHILKVMQQDDMGQKGKSVEAEDKAISKARKRAVEGASFN
ncbi:DNA (cytosine-5-)-methyltransferase [Bifidobacterium sp. ESL0763]|uniref:DNA (cytosine-5-)-methyltransferase n=1 Tax=Bifidobacterium sp. ESL0763 TaxID=2983227 RepID=UPI0023F76495|nr:DNA (cytosine-5-)-methyltransferase [Bifidobacterium sp. ESL0763]MDF7663957.1 DNA (cytosine-5-)-methyltransferase [Bifidobacterium sp. ESL0763]